MKKITNIAQLTIFFELRKNALVSYILGQLEKQLDESAPKIIMQLAGTRLVNNQLPKWANSRIESISVTLDQHIQNLFTLGYAAAFNLSDLKSQGTDELVNSGSLKTTANFSIPFSELMKIKDFSGGSTRALKAFVNDRGKNFNLSANVWKITKVHSDLIKEKLTAGLIQGKPATEIAKEVLQFTNNPQGLAQLPGQGQGVYKDPKKNAMRMVRTEINRAYRKADANRWATKWYVKGIEIKRSHNHHGCDICDAMTGIYPKDYVFTGNHPNCLCYAVALLVPKETQLAMTAYKLTGEGQKPEYEQYYIKDIPEKARRWFADNFKQMSGWKNLPYVFTDNAKYYGLAA